MASEALVAHLPVARQHLAQEEVDGEEQSGQHHLDTHMQIRMYVCVYIYVRYMN